jgi:hypothetical protein
MLKPEGCTCITAVCENELDSGFDVLEVGYHYAWTSEL